MLRVVSEEILESRYLSLRQARLNKIGGESG